MLLQLEGSSVEQAIAELQIERKRLIYTDAVLHESPCTIR
jgi:hypothetical protein